MDINKHFECSNVRPEDYVKFASFQLKDQAADWFQQYKDSRGGRVITWTDFCQDFKAHHIPTSVVESKREEFRNLKQGNMSVYEYNKQFQKLAHFAKQDVPDEKSMIYQFRGGLREDLQLALVLVEPTQFDQFYNMALKQEAARSSVRLLRRESETQFSLLLPHLCQLSNRSSGCLLLLRFVSLTSRRTKVAIVLPTLAIRTSLRIKLQSPMLLITVHSQR